jgi:uncharacterized protein YcnI
MAGAAPGNYTVKVKNGANGTPSNGVTLRLTSEVSVRPSSGTAGTQFSYQGKGFTGSNGVTSHLRRPDGSEYPTLQIPTSSSGEFTNTIESGAFTAGTYQVWALDNNTGLSSNTASFVVSAPQTVTPTITSISPSQVVGSNFTLTINGTGFDSTTVDQIIFPSGFTGSGTRVSWSANQVVFSETMAGAAPGNYTVKVKNGANGTPSNGVTLRLTSEVSVTPSSGTAGTQFSYQGKGFTGSNGVTSHLRRPDGSEYPTLQIPTSSSGEFTNTINSAGFARGTYQVWAVDNNTGIVSNTRAFTVN